MALRVSVRQTVLWYGALLIVAIGCLLLILHQGKEVFPVDVNQVIPTVKLNFNHLLHVLLALCSIIIVTRAMGALFQLVHQPPVIGEVIGGIMLGPSLLGQYAPSLAEFFLPSASTPFLSVIAQIGIILYMFLVGMELDLKIIKKSGHAALAISHASIVLPFLLGTLLAFPLFLEFRGEYANFTGFALFMGVSMSITAFPVLARILSDKNLQKTNLGALALTCAAIDDVTAWCLLALVVSVIQSSPSNAVFTMLMTIGYIAFMLVILKPLVGKALRWYEKTVRISENGLAVVSVGVLFSALITESIGIHAIFGGFLLGAIIPPDSRMTTDLNERLEDLIRVLFLPAFFAFTGLRTQIGLLSSLNDWLLCGGIILVAVVGKFGGSFVAARLSGFSWRDSSGVGILMNTRGLVELIVLNIGLDLRVISPRLFTMLVMMALVTTMMTGPFLNLILRMAPMQTPGREK